MSRPFSTCTCSVCSSILGDATTRHLVPRYPCARLLASWRPTPPCNLQLAHLVHLARHAGPRLRWGRCGQWAGPWPQGMAGLRACGPAQVRTHAASLAPGLVPDLGTLVPSHRPGRLPCRRSLTSALASPHPPSVHRPSSALRPSSVSHFFLIPSLPPLLFFFFFFIFSSSFLSSSS